MSREKPLKLACIGAGYFAQFHLEAWKRIPEVELVAVCDLHQPKALAAAERYHIPRAYTSVATLLEQQELDLVDIITPPASHFELCQQFANHGIPIICQKPLAPSYRQAVTLVETVSAKVPLHIHENFRFQPWYRQIKTMLDRGAIGDQVHHLYMQTRLGDGWQPDAYLQRQPYFRTMPQLLIFETGIHFIDTFRYLLGEVESVFADLRKLNPKIAGEDCAMVWFKMANGARALWDANRYNESRSDNPRYTFGEMLLEGNQGSIRLYPDGLITWQNLGQPEEEVKYEHRDHGFGGDCVYLTQRHLAECLLDQTTSETEGTKYLQNLRIQEAIYESASTNRVIQIA